MRLDASGNTTMVLQIKGVVRVYELPLSTEEPNNEELDFTALITEFSNLAEQERKMTTTEIIGEITEESIFAEVFMELLYLMMSPKQFKKNIYL